MSEWTQGPWRIAPYLMIKKNGARYRFISSGFWCEFARVCVRFPDSKTDESQGVANAHLIAAAPELYDALERLCAVLDPSVFTYRQTMEARKEALVAMAKARGENP